MFKNKITALLLGILMILSVSMAGCSSTPPSTAVKGLLDAYKKNDSAAATKFTTDMNMDMDAQLKEDLDGIKLPEDFRTALSKSMRNFEYKVIEESEKDGKGTVKVEMKVMDLEKAVKSKIDAIMATLQKAAESTQDEAALQDVLMKELSKIITENKEIRTVTLDLTVEKVSGEWKVVVDEKFEDALSAYIDKAFNELQ